MAELNDRDLEKWFNEVFLPNNPTIRDRYEGENLSEDAKYSLRMQIIETEKNRRIDEEIDARMATLAENGENIPQEQTEATREQIRTEIENEINEENRRLDNNDQEVVYETVTNTTERAGYTSDEWEQLFTGDNTRFLNEKDFLRGVDVVTLDEMGKLPANFSSLSNDEKSDTIARLKAELTPEERQQFNENENNARKRILEVYPPKRLVDTDKWLEEAQNNTEDDALKQRITNSRQTLMETMESKINAYANDEIVVDQSNIADVYDGAKLMFDYVEKRSNNDTVKTNIATSRDKLEKEIKIYDENNGFSDLSASNSAEIYQAYQRATKSSANTPNPPEEYASLWNNIEFSDETQRDENIALFNEAALKQAIRNVAVKHKDAKGDKLDTALKDELHAVYTEQLGALIIANEMQKNCTNPKYTPDMAKTDMEKVIADLQTGKKYQLDNKSLVGNFANYTNDNMGYLNRLGTKIGEKAPVLGSMYDAVKKFDDTCIKRFNPLYGQIRSFGCAVKGNMARQALNQAVRWGTQLVPSGNFVYGSYVAGQAIWRLGTKYKREKEEAKQNGKKLSGWSFLKNNVGEIASSAMLSVGAFIPGGNQALALGASALAIGTNMIKTYRRSREKGESWLTSLGKSFTSAGASVGTAVVSSLLLGKAIEASGVDDFAANYFAKTVPAGEFDPDNPNYSQRPVTDSDKIEELKGLSDKDLADKGYTFEHTTKDAEGAFLINEGKEGFTSHDYSQEELQFAEGRNDGIRYSEYLDKQWVHEDYQDLNSTNPLAHSETAHDNAISSLDKLAESHKEMCSYHNGEFVSNSEMLLYKLYQANVLAPNADAMSDSGIPIGEMLGATDANGNLITYQDVFQKVLQGQELNETDYNIICKVEDHVGGQLTFDENGNRILNDMGKIKDFDTLGQGGNPDSYNANADKGYEINEHEGEQDQYGRFKETTYNGLKDNVFGMVYDNQEKGAEKELKERIGANGKQKDEVQEKIKHLRKKIHREDEEIIPIPEDQKLLPVHEEKEQKYLPLPKEDEHKRGYGKLLADEYKIMYGVEPKVIDSDKPSEHKQYQHWINYNNRVDAERQATGRDIDMYDFLAERRATLDKVIADNSASSKITVAGRLYQGSEVSNDYDKHSENPEKSAIIRGARQSLWQSNLSSENYNDVLTLSHFTDYVSHYEKSDILTSDGTRDATLNTPLKRELEKASDGSSSHYTIIDLNDFYTRGIHTKSDKEIKDYINNSEEQAFKAKQKMQRIAKENPKNRVTTAKKKSFHER